MPTILLPIIAEFGPALAGLTGSVGYTVLDAGGTVRIARTTAGVSEQLDAAGTGGTGTYRARPTLDVSWLPCEVQWDITGQAQVGASAVVGADVAAVLATLAQAAAGGGYQLTALALALTPTPSSSGTGGRTVTQDYGGSGNLAVVDAHGNGIAGVTVQAFLTADWTASPLTAPVRAQQVTLATGAWAGAMNLDPGAYTFVFSLPGFVDSTKAVTVT